VGKIFSPCNQQPASCHATEEHNNRNPLMWVDGLSSCILLLLSTVITAHTMPHVS